MEDKEKILIMGPGSSGTTFCFRLLQALGFDTGNEPEVLKNPDVKRRILAGEDVELPKVIKHQGGFILNLSEHIERHNWKVQHIFLALRGLDNHVEKVTLGPAKIQGKKFSSVMKGTRRIKYWNDIQTDEGRRQALLHYTCSKVGMAIMQIIQHDYPFTVVCLPRSIEDPRYCYEKFKPVIGNMSFEAFEKRWRVANTSCPETDDGV